MYTGTLVEFLGVGGGELMLILVVVLLLFGGKKLPELARGLGKGLRDFKDASEGVKREIHRNINEAGLTEEINDFKSVLSGDNSRPNNYDYKPGEQSEISKSYDGGSGYNDEAAHYNSTEHTDTEHTANAESVENVDHTENAKNVENVETTEPVTHADHKEHTENRNG